MDAFKKVFSGKRSWRSSQDQTPLNRITEELRSATAANLHKKQKVSERSHPRTLGATDSIIMTKESERQQEKDTPEPFVDGSTSYTRTVSGREYQSTQFLNQPLKPAGGGIAGNSGAMLIQTGTGSSGDSGSLTLATGASASCGAGDMAAIVGPIDSATGGGAFTLAYGNASTGAGGNAVVTAGTSGGDDAGLLVMAANSFTTAANSIPRNNNVSVGEEVVVNKARNAQDQSVEGSVSHTHTCTVSGRFASPIENQNAKSTATTAGIEAVLKIGMKVPVENRVQWVKLPSGGKTESIKWWPGVLYESYTELIQDVENRHFKARFILLQFRFGFDEDQKVALVFEGNMHRIRTFRSPEDMEDQVVNFYDNMDPLFTFVDRKHADYRKLEQAVQRVLELVHQAVGSPASSVDQESLFKREVSPDLDVNAGLAVAQYASSTIGSGHREQDKISSSARATLNDIGNGNTLAEEEGDDGSDEDEDDGIQIESCTAANSIPRNNNVSVGGEVVVNKARNAQDQSVEGSVSHTHTCTVSGRFASAIENQNAKSIATATAVCPHQSCQKPVAGTDNCNTSNNHLDMSIDMPEGSNESPATSEVPFDEPPVKRDSSGTQIGKQDHWNLVISKLEHKHQLEDKKFNGDWILIKQEYMGYTKEQITDDLELGLDYFKRENEDEALKSFAYDKYGWIGKDGNYKPASGKRSPKKTMHYEPKQTFHRNKGKKKIAKKSPSASAKHRIGRSLLVVQKTKKPSKHKIAKSSPEPNPKKSDAGEKKISNAIDRREKADIDLQLELIPKEVKADFNKVGFALFEGKYLPAIQISPFEISQCPIRNEWEMMFNKWDIGGRKGDLPRMVYWYGQDHDENAPQLSLVDANNIQSLNNGKGLDTPLPYGDDPDKLAYTEALQDMLLDPKSRISWVRKIEEEKKKQLSTIPTRNRLGFHQIGFGKVGQRFFPVIQLSPFEVNKEVRVKYFTLLKKCSSENEMKMLVFLYGTKHKGSKDAFHFLPESHFIHFNSPDAEKYNLVSKTTRNKIFDESQALGKDEELVVHGIYQMLKESKLKESERGAQLLISDDTNIMDSYSRFCRMSNRVP